MRRHITSRSPELSRITLLIIIFVAILLRVFNSTFICCLQLKVFSFFKVFLVLYFSLLHHTDIVRLFLLDFFIYSPSYGTFKVIIQVRFCDS